MTEQGLGRLRERATDLLREYKGAHQDDKTGLARAIAETFVDIREHFVNDETGNPDWRGKTYPYRQMIGEIFSGANVPKDDASKIQAALRYHVGNVLRDRLSEDELDDLGLRAETPRRRSQQRRESRTALLYAATTQAEGVTPVGALRALHAASALLGVACEGAADLAPKERQAADQVLDLIAEQVADLRKVTAAKRKRSPE